MGILKLPRSTHTRRAFARLLLAAVVPLLALVSQPRTGHAGAPSVARPTPAPTQAPPRVRRHVLGYSTDGWPIVAYQIGEGRTRLAFIGGIHGGYEWNSVLLAYEALDYFVANAEQLPRSVSLYIIPSANPDGQVAVVGHVGRFTPGEVGPNTARGRVNGNGVDLNRNWGCNWERIGVWAGGTVSGGRAPFSEVETRLLRRFLTTPPMDAVVFWHSAAPGVFPGVCESVTWETWALANLYAQASGYPAYEEFTAYEVTGDATDWLSARGIPAVVVELNDRADIDWPQNLAGMRAVIRHFGLPARDLIKEQTQPR